MVKLGLCFLLSGVVLLAVVQEGETALKCYSCYSPVGGICGNMTKVDKKKIDILKCSNSEKYCGVLQLRGNSTVGGQNSTSIKRGCFHNSNCDTTIGIACKPCQKDLCNSSLALVPSFLIGTITLWITKLFAN